MSRQTIERLQQEIAELKSEVASLKEALAFHQRHSSTQTAKTGEEFLRKLLGGTFTQHNAGHDIEVGSWQLEVKASDCSSIDNTRPLSTTRWTWHRIFGVGGRKSHNRLILLGKPDVRNRLKYRDPDSPYVIFDIPTDQARLLLELSKTPFIQITTNPLGQRTEKGRLFWTFETTRKELVARYAAPRGSSRRGS